MKTFKLFSSICLLTVFSLISGRVWGQVVYSNDFEFSGNLSSNNWSIHSGAATNPLSTNLGLYFNGYSGSGTGNSVFISNLGGQDVNQIIPTISNDGQAVYFSFLVNVSESGASKTGEYFIHLGNGSTGTTFTGFSARVFSRIVSNNVQFGISNTSTISWCNTNYSKNTTYLLVVKFVLSTSSYDPLSLWILTTGIPVSESQLMPDVTNNITDGGTSINAVGIRQGGTGTTSVQCLVDGLRVSKSWLAALIPSYTGSLSSDPSVANNWSPAAVPASTASVVIPSGLTNYPSFTNNSTTSFGSITIDAGASLTLQSGAQLTLTGSLTNNGTMTIESGATLVQTTNSSTITGAGTYQVKQALNASGRFWYLGVPMGALTEADFLANLTGGETLKKRDEAANQWTTVTSNSTAIPAGRGYYVQNPSTTPTLTFQGTGVGYAFNNGAITTENLTSAGSGFTGFNLVSNPYPSYLDWVSVTKTNVGGTMWYRTHDGSGMNFGTVNSSGVGTTIGSTTVTRYIPPMQSFWVRVASNGQAASLTFNNSGRSHFISENSSVAGLKSGNVSPSLFVRMNLKHGLKSDQLIVYTDELSSNGLDINDAEKMMQATNPQFYTKVGTQKTVINALNPSKKQQALPITMELPTTGVHSFVIEDLEISNGLVWLEDKQEEIMQALEPGTVYEFYANSGINAERFVLHFQLIDNTTPINVYNEVNGSANFSGKGASVHAEAAGVVVIKLPATTEGITDIQIRDAAGKLVYTGATNTLETSVQLVQANGIYYVTLNSTSGVEVRKVFIQQ